MKFRAFRRSFIVAFIAFACVAFLLTGWFTAYIGTRTVGFDSHTTLLELCDLHTVRFMDWYFETNLFSGLLQIIINNMPIG